MLDLVAPVYNEGSNIENLLTQVENAIKVEKRLMLIYDSDDDNTIPAVERVRAQYSFPICLKKNIYGRGALNAIKTGLHTFEGNIVLVLMADLSDSLDVVDKMYDKVVKERYHLVCGSRYMKGGKQYGGPFIKKILSRFAGVSLHWTVGIPTHDISNSFKMYHRAVIDSITIESCGGFEIGMEITVKAFCNGYRITEVPSLWYDRVEGESRFQLLKWLPNYLKWYWFVIRETWLNGGHVRHVCYNNKNDRPK
ncbi:glycosyltransferase involved in cell wall biosynthesis [Sporomusaceae bacterium BoRhaA]|uniref:glycosyltransferase n=1 Tax=Pelorhabdus rhamnosifermentans TaxID=2772457 RepID=UPI001C063ABB|nr:glycosyltransferase [Pelorhabdus rhamnosifermentans]MBU2702849.1 glycosyltransferase involved in cell wall biosynthesis [Pelorhabdus rhamnosifermentans]